jgi:putative PIN family toxin of toxin-antitoxin system
VRAVLDPNVIISALIAKDGAPAEVLRSWRAGRFEVVVSPLLLGELRRALAYPKLRRLVSPDEAASAVHLLVEGATLAEDSQPGTPRSADPDDDYLIALAAEQRAALVSGDRHLLELQGQIPVYSPHDFLVLIGVR